MKKKPTLEKFYDRNGNKCVKIYSASRKQSFSIQTNGNLPITHRSDVLTMTNDDLIQSLKEIYFYTRQFETDRNFGIIYDVCMNAGIKPRELVT
jgi:hypothetical protein